MNQRTKTNSSYKDLFLHLLSIITLYGSAISLLVILFQTINIYFPDILESRYAASGARSMIRFNVSALVVMFPTYVWTLSALGKMYEKDKSKKELRIRSFLINLTLFIGALVLIGNLITLIYSFLGGELTTRVLLKILSVFIVVGSVFSYYFFEEKK